MEHIFSETLNELAGIFNTAKTKGRSVATAQILVQAYAVMKAADHIAAAIDNHGEALSSALSDLEESLRSDHPLQGETFGGIENTLGTIGESLQNIATVLDDRLSPMKVYVKQET